jgi:predicted HicB family RNase H-like nuclease
MEYVEMPENRPLTLNHNGFRALVQFDPIEKQYNGRIINIKKSVVTFNGYSEEEVGQNFKEIIEQYLNDCAAQGVEPEVPQTNA